MRSVLYSLLSLATVASALAVDPLAKRAAAVATPDDNDDDWDEKVPDTIFNGQTVPPMRELGTDLDEAISHGNWLVEFFSPKCPHCVAFKPTWQTLYEFYYTSKPPIRTKDDGDDDGQDGLNSFTRYYDFKIAKVDCIAFKDACVAHDINSFPVMKQFKDGKEISERKGSQSLPDLSAWVEDILEKIRPGSRVQGGPKLPKVGANSVDTGPATEGEAKEVAAAKESAAPPPKTEPTKAAKPPPPKPKSTANPSGVSEELTPERFQEAVTNTMEPWFIKFYAPWCHHCQAMAPNWSQMAREMKGKLNVGEVNCDEQKRLCKDAGVKGYPTIQFFRGPERIEYNGMRGLGDFIDYANKAVEVGLGIVDVNAAEFKKLEETEEVIFTYFYDHATTTEDFQALERLTLSLVGQGRLVKTNDKELFDRFKISTWPRLMVSRDGKPTFYSPIAPKDMRDNQKVLTWMKSVWLPIVPELKSSNARDIMDGKLVVLAILSRDRADEFAHAKRELKNAALEWIDREEKTYQLELQELRDAKNLRIEEAEDKGDQRALRAAKQTKIDIDEKRRQAVGFAWVDGAFWERWIKTTYGIDVKDGERVIINDELNHRYWDNSASGEPIRPSRTSILEALATLARSPASLPAKSTSSSFVSFFRAFHAFFSQHWFLSLGCVVGAFVAVMLFGRRRRPGYFQVGEKEGFMGNRGLGKND